MFFFRNHSFFPQGVVNVSSTEGLSSSERPGIATQSRFPDVNIPINQPRYLLESPDSLFESGSSGSTSQLLHPQFRIVKSTCLLWLNPLLDGFLVSSSFLVKCQPLEAPVFPDSNHFTSNLFKTSNSLHPSPLHCPTHPIFRWPQVRQQVSSTFGTDSAVRNWARQVQQKLKMLGEIWKSYFCYWCRTQRKCEYKTNYCRNIINNLTYNGI